MYKYECINVEFPSGSEGKKEREVQICVLRQKYFLNVDIYAHSRISTLH